MATFEVTIEKINVFPHPNADRLELAQVGLYNIVVAKGTWNTGDEVLYIPEYAVLPENLINALGLEGKLAGSKKDRVKPVRLRGELSQGLVAPLDFLPKGAVDRIGKSGNFMEELGITKWVPEIPVSMSGDVEANYGLVPWIDIENIKKFPDMFAEGEEVIVDEKIHGTASLYTFINPLSSTPEILVSSKGLGERKLVLKSSDSVLYWKVVKEYSLEKLASAVAFAQQIRYSEKSEETNKATVTKVGIFGETFGSRVQDLHYGFTAGNLGFRVFDIFVEYTDTTGTHGQWLDPEEVTDLADAVPVLVVPRLYKGPFSIQKIKELASGKEQVSGQELHIREGVVVRPVERPEGHYEGGKRIGKFVSDEYLTRGGNPTEYN